MLTLIPAPERWGQEGSTLQAIQGSRVREGCLYPNTHGQNFWWPLLCLLDVGIPCGHPHTWLEQILVGVLRGGHQGRTYVLPSSRRGRSVLLQEKVVLSPDYSPAGESVWVLFCGKQVFGDSPVRSIPFLRVCLFCWILLPALSGWCLFLVEPTLPLWCSWCSLTVSGCWHLSSLTLQNISDILALTDLSATVLCIYLHLSFKSEPHFECGICT